MLCSVALAHWLGVDVALVKVLRTDAESLLHLKGVVRLAHRDDQLCLVEHSLLLTAFDPQLLLLMGCRLHPPPCVFQRLRPALKVSGQLLDFLTELKI